jgi:PQQ-like domain
MTVTRRQSGRQVRPGRIRGRRPGPRRLTRHRLARRSHPAVRRIVLTVALLAVLILPLAVLASDVPQRQPACQGSACRVAAASPQRWAKPLPGTWLAGTAGDGSTGDGGSGDGGTVPATGQAYVAAGDGVAVVGAGLAVTGYNLASGERLWPTLTLSAPAGTVIMSVRAWPGVVTVGLLAPDGRSRTEVVIDAVTGAELRRYPAAVFGGAVAAAAATTVVIGTAGVTSYDNATGRVRWQHPADAGQSWQADGGTLYLAQSKGGSLSPSPVTALKVIDLSTGAERMLSSPLGRPFSGTLALAADGAVLFAAPAGVTAYSGSTGWTLWTMAGAVPEGTDPQARQVYLTAASGTLRGVDPLTGALRSAVPASAIPASGSVYVVRDGVAFGLYPGASGSAWGYSAAAGRVSWTSAALPWPHFFSDVSGLGGSAATSGDTVIVTACPHLAASPQFCADPELIAFTL